jgi:hypothetical protein
VVYSRVTIAHKPVPTAPRHSANLCVPRVSALAFLFPRLELSTFSFKLSASPLNPFPSHHSGTRAGNSFPLISLRKTGGIPPAWSDHASSVPSKGCRLMANGCLLSPFHASLAQKQGGVGYWSYRNSRQTRPPRTLRLCSGQAAAATQARSVGRSACATGHWALVTGHCSSPLSVTSLQYPAPIAHPLPRTEPIRIPAISGSPRRLAGMSPLYRCPDAHD